jgi:RNA polymerase sigma-70 factor (ECF subfamily)
MPETTLLYEQLSDAELLQLTKQENIRAFEELYKRHWAFLIDIAYKRLQSRHKAEDLVQELFITLYQKRNSLEITFSLKAYLSQALKYRVLNEFRAEGIRTTYAQSLFFSDVCKNDFVEGLEAKELSKKIELSLAGLPSKCRQVFLLSRRENMSNKEISNELNISVSTVEKHIGKALKTLKDDIRKYTSLN